MFKYHYLRHTYGTKDVIVYSQNKSRKEGGNKMEELYSIMWDFLEVEYNQESLVCLLKAAETAYTWGEQVEAKLIANSAKYYLNALQEELKVVINRLDSYIAENAKKQ